MNTNKHHEDWELRESGPAGANHTVLLLAGALVTAAYYDDVLAEPRLKETSVRFVAATLPGHAGTQPPDDLSMDNYARLAGKLAADFRCDAVVGHSLGANVAIEMLAAGHFSGPLLLLAPSFSREDESKFPRALDRISRVLGHLPYAGDVEGDRTSDEKQLAGGSQRCADRGDEQKRSALPPATDPPLPRIPGPPRLAGLAPVRHGRPGVGRVRRATTSD